MKDHEADRLAIADCVESASAVSGYPSVDDESIVFTAVTFMCFSRLALSFAFNPRMKAVEFGSKSSINSSWQKVVDSAGLR